jgi:uncharacterized protein (TIGR00251 family)
MITLAVKLIPKASRSEVVGWENDELKIRLRAVPEKGEANEELIAFLSKILNVSKSQITLLRGQKSRHKLLQITGISAMDLDERLPLKKIKKTEEDEGGKQRSKKEIQR